MDEHVALDLSEIMSEVQRAMVPALTGRAIEVTFATVPALQGVYGNAREIEQVVLNLLTNAVKFTPDGGRVDLQVIEGADEVRIVVADTGGGISEADQPHLVRRFYRAPSAIEAEVPGTGLGLSLAKSIVEAHGGAISVSSVLGDGSTFVVALPRHDAADVSRPATPAGHRSARNTSTRSVMSAAAPASYDASELSANRCWSPG